MIPSFDSALSSTAGGGRGLPPSILQSSRCRDTTGSALLLLAAGSGRLGVPVRVTYTATNMDTIEMGMGRYCGGGGGKFLTPDVRLGD